MLFISFSLGTEQLSYFGYDGETILESGIFDIHIGLNSKETMTKSLSWCVITLIIN